MVVRDDALANAQSYTSKLYHLYNEAEVKEVLNRRAEPHEPLPDLVQKAYALLAYDWRETARQWTIESAARVERFFTAGDCLIPETRQPDRTLQVDSRVLEKAERGESAAANKDYAQRRRAVLMAAGPETTSAKRCSGPARKSNCAAWSIQSANAVRPASASRM